MKNEKYSLTVDDIIKNNLYCPIELSIIPNKMGINLCAVDSIEWEVQPDGQLVNLKINFIPEER